MSEPTRFVLNDKLWRNLSSQYLEDSLLCSSRKDAIKWRTVSKGIKEVIEEHWDKIPLFKNFKVEIQFPRKHKIILSGDSVEDTEDLVRLVRVDDLKGMEIESSSSSPIQPSKENFGEWTLVEPSTTGLMNFLEKLVQCCDIRRVTIFERAADWTPLKPLAVAGDAGARFRFIYRRGLDEDSVDALKLLHVQILDVMGIPSWPFIYRAKEVVSLEEVDMTAANRYSVLEAFKNVPVITGFKQNTAVLVLTILVPWYKGELPNLRKMRGGTGPPSGAEDLMNSTCFWLLGLFWTERINYVPQKNKYGYGFVRAFLVTSLVGQQAQIVLTGYPSGYIRFEFDLLE